jgi:hypothetical protein
MQALAAALEGERLAPRRVGLERSGDLWRKQNWTRVSTV